MDNVVLLTNPVKPKTTQDTANKYNQSTPAKYTGAIPKVFKISAKSKKKKEILEQTKRPKPNLSVHKQSQSITKSASAADDAIGIQTAVAAAKVNENLSTNNLPVPTFTIDIDNAAYGPRDPPLELWPNMELSDSKAKGNGININVLQFENNHRKFYFLKQQTISILPLNLPLQILRRVLLSKIFQRQKVRVLFKNHLLVKLEQTQLVSNIFA